jgi:alpha-mannosidase
MLIVTHVRQMYNRKCEYLMRNAELLSSWAAQTGFKYEKTEFERLWKLVCLNQFHDVLPGRQDTNVDISYQQI